MAVAIEPPIEAHEDLPTISVKQAVRRYRVSRSAIFQHLRDGFLRRYRKRGNRNTLLSLEEADQFYRAHESLG